TNSRNKTIEEIRDQVERWGLAKDTVDHIFTESDHSGRFNVGRYTRYMEDMMRVKNAIGLCTIYTYQGLLFGDDIAELYTAASGHEITALEMVECGERIHNVTKMINVHEGFNRIDDAIPEVWFRPMESPEGRIEMQDYYQTKTLTKDDTDKILDDYYDERGWDSKTGCPTAERLKHLGLDEFAAPSTDI
ncbi:unnamed protein product, partial [marine sediment metagenome]